MGGGSSYIEDLLLLYNIESGNRIRSGQRAAQSVGSNPDCARHSFDCHLILAVFDAPEVAWGFCVLNMHLEELDSETGGGLGIDSRGPYPSKRHRANRLNRATGQTGQPGAPQEWTIPPKTSKPNTCDSESRLMKLGFQKKCRGASLGHLLSLQSQASATSRGRSFVGIYEVV